MSNWPVDSSEQTVSARSFGAMPVCALSGGWGLYLMLNVATTWNKGWEYWNGIGPRVSAQFIYDNDNLWPGAHVRLIPTYTYFVAGELENDGSGNIEVNVGGQITPTLMSDVTAQKNVDVDLRSCRREPSRNLENDWNVFFDVTSYVAVDEKRRPRPASVEEGK